MNARVVAESIGCIAAAAASIIIMLTLTVATAWGATRLLEWVTTR